MREPTELRARGGVIRGSSTQPRDQIEDRNRAVGRGVGFDLVLDRFRFEKR